MRHRGPTVLFLAFNKAIADELKDKIRELNEEGFKDFEPSSFQQAVFDWVRNGKGSTLVNAVAGSGKTFTALNALGHIPGIDLSKIHARTFHSVCFAAWKRYANGNVDLDDNKCKAIFREMFSKLDGEFTNPLERDKFYAYSGFVLKLVSLAKGAGVGHIMSDEPMVWWELRDHFDVWLTVEEGEKWTEEQGIEYAQTVLKRSREVKDIVDYDDMLYMPLVYECSFFRNDWVIIDESQDTNAVQRALLKRMLQRNGRLMAIGDPNQAIYGFRGADSAAMEKIAMDFGAGTLPLSVSYRCAQAVVEAAREWVPRMEAHESAPLGSVGTWDEQEHGELFAALRPDDVIICRTNAPLVDTAYGLIQRGIGCKILGREIGQGLVNLIERMKAKGIDSLIKKLDAFEQREVTKFLKKDKEDKAEAVKDRVQCIRVVINRLDENHRTVPSLISAIEALFQDKNGGNGTLTLCSCHKAKGLEWDRVFILDRWELMPSKWARQDWQQEQEANLLYVSYTRARKELWFV